MQTVARSNFTAVKTEGALLPADLLQRIADGELDGLQPEAYHLLPTERLNEAINRAWNRCLGVWQSFVDQRRDLPDSDSGVSLTRSRWLLILLHELGYGNLPFQRQIELADGSTYPISHQWGEHTPIHLVSFRQELDKRDPAIRRSPHSLMQELLNRSEDHMWGFVSNGLTLRILRDNVSLTRAAYVEFDLEAIMTGEVYADFSLLWLICHQSRVEIGADLDGPKLPSNCWLEQWSQTAADQGTRALDALRDGVQEAIAALGRGFLAHPANGELRSQLKSGTLSTQDYYRELLRLVYRLIFLFVAEDRDLLLLTESSAEARTRYTAYYSLGRLRQLAVGRRGGPHPDLYRTLRQVSVLLRSGYAPLGLPALGSFLFSERATPTLDALDIANHDLLEAIRALAFATQGQVRRPVDYKNLGSEELGSVYESLLELHPQLNVDAAKFALETAAGSERKTTGSYYTPSSLINSLLDSALEPVIRDRLTPSPQPPAPDPRSPIPDPHSLETALLAIKVVDPACGSGHFLIAAAHRLARHLARVRTGDDEPGPAAQRAALRDVVGHCIYGVDINEMSVELCKVALWMETLDPGKPLSFLDANIQCGNSLLGATPALLARGIPDEAFTPITGDDKAYCTEWKKRNREQRTGQLDMFARGMQPWERLGNFAQAMRALETMADDTVADVEQQRAAYEKLVSSSDYEYGKLWADAWVAAFLWVKRAESPVTSPQSPAPGFPYPITEQVFREIERSPFTQPPWLKAEIKRLAAEYRFFHWHLAFPQVFMPQEDLTGLQNLSGLDDEDVTGWAGGFDVVLGNPPWERIKLQEKEWFASRDEAIATAPNAAARRRLIAQLPKTNPALHEAFEADKRRAEGESAFVRSSGKYPLCGRGDVNTYTLFAELARHVQSDAGRVGVIVPSGIATDDTTKYYFQDIMDSAALASLYDFENRNAIFPGVHRSYKFCLLTLTGVERPAQKGAQFVFFALDVADLRDEERCFTLSAADIALLNPNTRTCPIFRSKRDAELTKAIYRRVPVLIKEEPPEGNPWGIKFFTMFHMSNDSGLFCTREQLEGEGWRLVGNRFVRGEAVYLPLYEAKMLHHFDHRWATYENSKTVDFSNNQKSNPDTLAQPRYWVSESEVVANLGAWDHNWFLSYRDIARNNDERTTIASAIPLTATGCHLCLPDVTGAKEVSPLLGNLNSFVCDFVVRQKVGGTHLNFFYVKQFPIVSPETYHQPCPWQQISHLQSPISTFLLLRNLELTYTAYDLRPFAQECGYHGPPFRWDEERRFLLRCELDAAYFHLYGIERDDVAYIMDTFPIVKRKDEKAHGEYRTKRVILEIYDEMATAMQRSGGAEEQGRGYQTRLNPPPAHPDAAHQWDEAYLGPELPRDQWWQEVKDEGRGARPEPVEGMKDEKDSESSSPVVREPQARYEVKTEPAVLELRHPEPPRKKEKPAQTSASSQQPLLDVMPAPSGPRPVRLKRAMQLGKDTSPSATRELVAFLADEDSNIRWLASSSLLQRPTLDTVQAITAFLQHAEPERIAQARSEAIKVLEMFAETAENEDVREAAKTQLTSK